MERLLQEFEQPVTDKSGAVYKVYLYGRSRPGDTWQGWLVFERASDGRRFATDVETTQSNAEAILYWATGLTGAYFDGALERAQRPRESSVAAVPMPPPVVGEIGDSESRRQRLADVERAVLASFARRGTPRALTQSVFDELLYAHADVVRAIEDLEKQGGMLVRRTEEGNDWLFLTHRGIEAAGLSGVAHTDGIADREPPRMS